MRFNIYKVLTPDFPIGKLIVTRKSISDSLKLLIFHPTTESLRFARLMLAVKPKFTMVTNKNLLTLHKLVQKVNRLNVPGDIVECGVWNGGSAAIMALADAQDVHNTKKRVIWLFDSFQGLPPATEKDVNVKRENYFAGWNKGEISNVEQVFRKLGLCLDRVKIVPGWFDSTLRTAAIDQIAVLHIDADWYESVKLVLDVFYEKVAPGGYIILNDYGTWRGCDQAVEDFFSEHSLTNIDINIVEPCTGAYFRKPVNQ